MPVIDPTDATSSSGILVTLMLLASGIVLISTRKSQSSGGIAIIILAAIGAIVGYTTAGTFTDLYIWATWLAIIAITNLIAKIKFKKDNAEI